jgi:hypothetical protein
MALTIQTLKKNFVECNSQRLAFAEALDEIRFMGTDCPPDFDREAFIEGQLFRCIQIAARAFERSGE